MEQSGYPLGNLGDVSMLKTAVQRLEELYPHGEIQVFTSAPEKLAQFCPQALPLSLSGRTIWYLPIIGSFYKLLSQPQQQQWWLKEWQLRQKFPRLVASLLQLKLKFRPRQTQDLQQFLDGIYNANLVIASGGGYINDSFPELASTVLGILAMAQQLGKPTVMLGHGVGPLKIPYLRSQAQQVLPHVSLITLREKRASLPLLESLGVSSQRIVTTGDEAIELAYTARQEELGWGIGVNLRVAHYADVSKKMITQVRCAVQSVAKEKRAKLIPVPISQYDGDSQTIKQLLMGYDDNSDGGSVWQTPEEIIAEVGKCRVVVTGSYHAGVFALSQGIPVIGLAKSPYYQDKFLGLADQFGVGCEVLFLNDGDLLSKLIAAINQAWTSAPELRQILLKAAQEQISLSRAAYEKILDLFP